MASYMFFDITHESITPECHATPPSRVCRRNPGARGTIRTWAEDVAREFGYLSVTSATRISTPEPLASEPTASPESSSEVGVTRNGQSEVGVPRNGESEVHVPRNGDTTQIHAPLAIMDQNMTNRGHTKPAVNTQIQVAETKASLLLPGMTWSPNANTGARIVSRLPTRSKGTPHTSTPTPFNRTTPTHPWSPSPKPRTGEYRAPIANPTPDASSTPHSTHSSHPPPHSPRSSHTPPHSPPPSHTRPLPDHEHEQHRTAHPLSPEHEYEQLLAEQRSVAAIREQEAQVARLRELARAARERRLSEGAASCRRQEAAIAELWRKLGRTR